MERTPCQPKPAPGGVARQELQPGERYLKADDLERAIEGYRRARKAEQRRHAVGTIAAVDAARRGASIGEASQQAQAVRAGLPTASVGGRPGLTAKERLDAQLKMAEVQGRLNDELMKGQAGVAESEVEREKKRWEIIADLTATLGSTAVGGAQAGADVTVRRMQEYSAIAQNAADKIENSRLVPSFDEKTAASQFISDNGLEYLRQHLGEGTSPNMRMILDQDFLNKFQGAVVGMQPDEVVRFAAALGGEINFPLEQALLSNSVADFAAHQGVDASRLAADQQASLNLLSSILGNQREELRAERDLMKQMSENARKTIGDLKQLPGAGTGKTQRYIEALIDQVLADDYGGAASTLANMVPENAGLDAAQDTMLNLPTPEAPLTSAFDAKQRIMESGKFKQQAAASGLDPEAFFASKLQQATANARQRVAQRRKPAEPPTLSPTGIDVSRMVTAPSGDANFATNVSTGVSIQDPRTGLPLRKKTQSNLVD